MRRLFVPLAASVMLVAMQSSLAEVRVVNSMSVSAQEEQKRQEQTSREQARAISEVHQQLQMLQEEVMMLRGMFEEQQFELEQIKQQQLDNYVDLDRRIGELGDRRPTADAPSAADTNAQAAYQAAYQLIPERKFEQARMAFESFVNQYNQSPLAANGYYWLGELYIIDGDKNKAKAAFRTILNDFPGHNKYPEALYKMAVINHEQGDRMTARQQLETLIEQSASLSASATTVAKARDFLQKNYP